MPALLGPTFNVTSCARLGPVSNFVHLIYIPQKSTEELAAVDSVIEAISTLEENALLKIYIKLAMTWWTQGVGVSKGTCLPRNCAVSIFSYLKKISQESRGLFFTNSLWCLLKKKKRFTSYRLASNRLGPGVQPDIYSAFSSTGALRSNYVNLCLPFE